MWRKAFMDIHQYKIMLVDDNRDLAEMIAGILRQSGYENIVTAGSVAEALEVFQRERPDMAVLDVMLPDGDGFRLFQKLREKSQIPILFFPQRTRTETGCLVWGLEPTIILRNLFFRRSLCCESALS